MICGNAVANVFDGERDLGGAPRAALPTVQPQNQLDSPC